MPAVSLNVPHYKQEFNYSCVPACVRMVLAHFGKLHGEAEMRQVLAPPHMGRGCETSCGSPASALTCSLAP